MFSVVLTQITSVTDRQRNDSITKQIWTMNSPQYGGLELNLRKIKSNQCISVYFGETSVVVILHVCDYHNVMTVCVVCLCSVDLLGCKTQTSRLT